MGGCFSSHNNGLNSKVDGREDDTLIGLSSNANANSSSRTLKCFTLKELKTATRNLVPDNQVREGGFCGVKGWIDEHTLTPTNQGGGLTIYVKKLNYGSHQEHSELLRKINNIGKLSHPNLARLIGYCLEDVYPILVYQFLEEGSLDNHLFHRDSTGLSWKMRMKIALDAAKGLAFLHSDKVQVIHGNFKTSNILIDSKHNAKLSDFGLFEKRTEEDIATRFTTIPQSYAPEYITTGRQYKRSDVYDFGVVLLEIMTGKQEFDKNRPLSEPNLVQWTMKLLNNNHKIFKVIDSCIEGQYLPREAMKVAHIAIQCLFFHPKDRPNMDKVVRSLEQLYESNDTVVQDIINV